MAEIDRRYFESLMADKKLSLRGLAKLMNMSHSQLSLAFNGARRISLEEAAQLSQVFGQPINRIAEAAGVSVRPMAGRRIAVVGAMHGDGTVVEYMNGLAERTSSPGDLPDDCIAIQARTSGTILEWVDGWVFFCRQHNGPDPSMYGRLCHLRIKGGPEVIATVRRGYRENTMNLLGPYIRENVTVEWASPIILTRN